MIAAWMIYGIVVSVALALGATVAEWGLERRRFAVRGVWGAALAFAVVIPTLRLSGTVVERKGAAETANNTLGVIRLPTVLVVETVARAGGSAKRVDLALLLMWGLVSFALGARDYRHHRQLQRARRWWMPQAVDGMEVLVAENAGPAVVGWRHGAVVVPRWLLEGGADERRIVLQHEHEHLLAGDARWQRVARLAVTALPWNPALWVIEHRLRTAIEVDCDRRVLASGKIDPRRYAALLLDVAGRARPSVIALPALSASYSLLARRIIAMSRAPRTSRFTLAACLAFSVLLLAVACATEAPQTPSAAPAGASPAWGAGSAVANASASPTEPYFEFQVDTPVGALPGGAVPRFPDSLRTAGVEGEVLAQFVVDTAGKAELATYKVLKSTHELFAAAIEEALPGMRFSPALFHGKRVRQLVQQPFSFAIAK